MNKYQEALNYLIENIEMLNRHSVGVDERLFNDNRYYLIQFSKELV